MVKTEALIQINTETKRCRKIGALCIERERPWERDPHVLTFTDADMETNASRHKNGLECIGITAVHAV